VLVAFPEPSFLLAGAAPVSAAQIALHGITREGPDLRDVHEVFHPSHLTLLVNVQVQEEDTRT